MSSSSPSDRMGARYVIALGLALVTMLLYARVGGYDFVNFDDPSYVSRNPVVSAGLTADGVSYAFQGPHSTNWHPLTTLSHMLDAELFGLDAGKHHLVSAGLHALNAALCFLALAALTRRVGSAALIAALFALHPLRVESVAWISERKDVLSGTFFFLTLLGWARYVRRPSTAGYALCLVAFALGLMAKQMLVTVPFLLIALDLWVLERKDKTFGALLLEKLPLVALAAGSIVLLWVAQSEGGNIGSLGVLPVLDRVANAFSAIFAYVRLSLVPLGLACFYPHPSIVHPDDPMALMLPAAVGAALVIGTTVVTLRRRAQNPAMLAGWLWFVGMLVPVIGLVQVGSQAYADRYTYLPAIGLVLMFVALLDEVIRARPNLRIVGKGAAFLALIGFSFATWNQLPYWEDTTTLNSRALRVTDRNYVAHNNLGLVRLEDELDPVLAESQFMAAIEINPYFREAVYNLALCYEGQGRPTVAEETLERLLAMDPSNTHASARLAKLRGARGDSASAIEGWRTVTEQTPDNVTAWLALARLYLEQGEGIYGQECAERALELDPNLVAAHISLGQAAQQLGYNAAAIKHYQRATEVDPESAEAYLQLARELASQGALADAKVAVERSIAIDDSRTDALIVLAKLLFYDEQHDAGNAALDMALRDAPDHPECNDLLGVVRMGDGDMEGAEEAFLRALETSPSFDAALHNLGVLYEDTARESLALEQYRKLLNDNVDSMFASGAARGLGWILATSSDESLRNGAEAVRWAQFSKSRSDPNATGPFEVLAAAYAEAGNVEGATGEQESAIERAGSDKQRTRLRLRLQLYKSGKAFHRPQ